MACAADQKLREAQNHIKEAEKCLKTGILKWKPDYESASIEYSKAAIAFKNAKSFNDAVECYLKQSEMELHHGSFQAARAMESAAMMCKESGDWSRAADLIDKSSNMYLEHGTGDTAAIMLNRGAKMIEAVLPEKAIFLYKKACDVSEAQDRIKEGAENIGKAGRIYIKLSKFDEAAKCVSQELDFLSKTAHGGTLNKTVMGLILIHLHREDWVAADQAFQKTLRYPGFSDSEEAIQIQRFLKAYEDGDEKKAMEIARGPLFAYIENDFAKLARDLKVPGCEKSDELDQENNGYGEGLL